MVIKLMVIETKVVPVRVAQQLTIHISNDCTARFHSYGVWHTVELWNGYIVPIYNIGRIGIVHDHLEDDTL